MRILAIVSQKGGVGKTTLTGHLGVQAVNTGNGPVALIDTDPQGSLASWWNEREATEPLFATVHIGRLSEHLAELELAGVKTVMIDTPPAITQNIEAVLAVAHLALIPTRPSPHDLRSVGGTVDLVERAGLPMVFVINGATVRTKITGQAAIALSQHGTVAPVTIHQRVDFASSMIDGRTVGELAAESHSAEEIAGLWNYVNTRLRKHSRKVDHGRQSVSA
jgi:chromosome partitioning protein